MTLDIHMDGHMYAVAHVPARAGAPSVVQNPDCCSSVVQNPYCCSVVLVHPLEQCSALNVLQL